MNLIQVLRDWLHGRAKEPEASYWVLLGGEKIYNPHSPEQCKGEYCCLHNPSDHPLADCPQHWRSDRRIMERRCEHGTWHPDPDDVAYQKQRYGAVDTMHGCCWAMCCVDMGEYR